MKDINEIKHEIRNHLQSILFALQAEADDCHRVNGKEAVQGILNSLNDINGGKNAED